MNVERCAAFTLALLVSALAAWSEPAANIDGAEALSLADVVASGAKCIGAPLP